MTADELINYLRAHDPEVVASAIDDLPDDCMMKLVHALTGSATLDRALREYACTDLIDAHELAELRERAAASEAQDVDPQACADLAEAAWRRSIGDEAGACFHIARAMEYAAPGRVPA